MSRLRSGPSETLDRNYKRQRDDKGVSRRLLLLLLWLIADIVVAVDGHFMLHNIRAIHKRTRIRGTCQNWRLATYWKRVYGSL